MVFAQETNLVRNMIAGGYFSFKDDPIESMTKRELTTITAAAFGVGGLVGVVGKYLGDKGKKYVEEQGGMKPALNSWLKKIKGGNS